MWVARRQAGVAPPNTMAVLTTINAGGGVNLANDQQDTADTGTEMNMTTANGRNFVHAAMGRIVNAVGGINGAYSW